MHHQYWKKTAAHKENKREQEDDASSQERMNIYVLAVQGASIRKIVEFFGYTKYMTARLWKRAEKVMKIGSVESKPKTNAGTGKKSVIEIKEFAWRLE